MPADKGKSSSRPTKETNTLLYEAIMTETIRKEQRVYKLNEEYALSPSALQHIVFTSKPTSTPTTMSNAVSDSTEKPRTTVEVDTAYLDYVARKKLHPKEKFAYPLTSGQEYGWDIEPLMRVTDPRFHHPRKDSEITRLYGLTTALRK